jgi:hypothetical protein
MILASRREKGEPLSRNRRRESMIVQSELSHLTYRAPRAFAKGVLGPGLWHHVGVPRALDPLRCHAQILAGRIDRLSHWTTPP